jgi:hypothetical protein
MAGTVIADNLHAASTSTLVIKNGVANTPPTIQDSGGTEIGTFCRAWVNFDGTGTVAIRASFNVSSITDNGTGNYTVNFTNAMPDANYATVCEVGGTTVSGSRNITTMYNPTTTSVSVAGGYDDSDNSLGDKVYFNVAIFR